MMALDTNVIVRFLVRDDEAQSNLVYKRLKKAELERERLFVPLVVMLEALWVLESAANWSRDAILSAIEGLRQMSILEIEADQVLERMAESASGTDADLSDLLIMHSAAASGCEAVLTFDKKAARLEFSRMLK